MKRVVLFLALVSLLAAYAAISAHSVGEIHYLKSFFPQKFTMQDAFYAAAIELIKDVIIAIPFLLAIATCLVLIGRTNNRCKL